MNRPKPGLRIRQSNTHFGELLLDAKSCETLFEREGEVPTLYALHEVSPARRHLAAAAIEAYGLQAVFPEGTNLDTVWAASRDLHIESTQVFPFRGWLQRFGSAIAAMRGRKHDNLGSRKRSVGVHVITVITPDGQRVRASQQHLSPPPLEPWRRQQADQLCEMFSGEGALAYRDSETLEVNVGDNNHLILSEQDLRLRELLPSLCDGSGTCDIYRTHPRLAGWMERFGVTTLPQLDAVHGQAPLGTKLAATNTPGPDEFGYATRRIWYTASGHPIASDHAITELDVYFPQTAAAAHPQDAVATLQN